MCATNPVNTIFFNLLMVTPVMCVTNPVNTVNRYLCCKSCQHKKHWPANSNSRTAACATNPADTQNINSQQGLQHITSASQREFMSCMPRILPTHTKLTILSKTKCKQVNRSSCVPWILSTHLEKIQVLSTTNPVNTQNTDNPVNTQSINMPTGTRVLCARNSSTHKKSTLHYETPYLVLTCTPGASYCRQLRSLLYLCCVFQTQINSLVCWFNGNLFVAHYNFCQHT